MKLTFTKIIYTVLCLLFTFNSKAAIYTAAASGNFSSTSTWVGGAVPPANLGANDIVIGGGITVTLDVNLVLSSSFSLVQLQSSARIASTSSHYISLSAGQITGDINSSIDVDSVYIGNSNISYSGTITANKITFAGPNLPGGITIEANEYMYFTSGLTNMPPGTTIVLASGTPIPTIVIDGGTFIVSGANFNLTTPYHVRYQQPSITIGAGVELTGSGLSNIEIAVGQGNSVALDKDLTVNGLLKLTSGSLALNFGSYKLIMAGNSSFDPGGQGTILGSPGAEIVITSAATNLGTVRFANGASEVKNLEIKAVNAAAELKLGSPLLISGVLTLQKGRINVQGNTLSIAGGIGSISGGSANSYVITEANGQLKQDVAASSTATYPVGHASAYTPAVITELKGATMAGMNVNVQQGVKDQGATGTDMAATKPLVNATWTTSMAGSPTNLDYKLELQWAAASEVNGFDRSKSFVSQYNNKWSNQAGTAAGTNGSLYTAQKSNVTSGGTFAVLDESTLSVDNIINGEAIPIYPNPAKNLLNIIVSEMATATFYNATGQVVLTAEIGRNNNIININHLPAGMYFVQLQGEETNGTARFVKE